MTQKKSYRASQLKDLRSSAKAAKAAEEELEWFFWYSEAAMGIHSNYSYVFASLQYNLTSEADLQSLMDTLRSQTASYDIMKATAKNRSILQKYKMLDNKNKVILEKYFQERQYDPQLMKHFGPKIGLIIFTELGQKLQQELASSSKGGPNAKDFPAFFNDKLVIERILSIKKSLINQIDEILHQAITAYAQQG